jgi:hypothetical protein
VAILNDKKYIIKGHSVFEALTRAGIDKFSAHFHFVNSFLDVVILHARLSQSNPVNPLSILDLRDYLIRSGMDMNDIARTCCLDPAYEKLLSCTLSFEARKQLSIFLNLLSCKLSRVVMPSYIIEIISKKPQEIQADIVKSIFASINDNVILNDKDFVFPNPDQVRMYANLYKKSEEQNGMIFEEYVENDQNHKTDKQYKDKNSMTNITTEKKKEIDTIVGNIPHMAMMIIGNKKYRLNWKNKTYAEINERKNNDFIIIHDDNQLQRMLALSPEQLKFLGLNDESKPYVKTITSSNQLRNMADKLDSGLGIRGILILNKNI